MALGNTFNMEHINFLIFSLLSAFKFYTEIDVFLKNVLILFFIQQVLISYPFYTY